MFLFMTSRKAVGVSSTSFRDFAGLGTVFGPSSTEFAPVSSGRSFSDRLRPWPNSERAEGELQ